MQQFIYKAIDRQGKTVEGSIEATTRDAAARSLSLSGLLVSRIEPSPRVQPTHQPPSIPPIALAPQARQIPKVAASASTPIKAAVSPVPAATPIRTRRGRDKDLYFIFSQLASYAKAGINLAEACANLSKTTRRADYAQSLVDASKIAEKGGRISDTFAKYVDLYPPHLVGMVRACEEGGFFPEGLNKAADQAMESHKFKRWFNWFGFIALTSFGCMPLAIDFFKAMKMTFTEMTSNTSSGGFWDTLFRMMRKDLAWPTGPATLMICLVIYLFWRWLVSRPQMLLRHRWILNFWGLRKRAQAESFALFGWTMSMLTRIGLPLRAVWFLSTATMPNQWIRHRMDRQGQLMNESTKLSEAMNQSRMLPEEFAPFVSTGEIAGDVPGQLMRIANTQYDEYKINDTTAKGRVGCWIILVIVVCGFLIYILYAALYLRPTMDEVLH